MASVLLPCPICGHNYREAQGCCQKPAIRAPYQRREPSTPANDENAPDSGSQKATSPESVRLYRAVRAIVRRGDRCFIVNEGGEYRVIRSIESYTEYDLLKRLVLTCDWSTSIEDIGAAI